MIKTIQEDLIEQANYHLQKVLEDDVYDELTRSQAEQMACEKVCDLADEIGLYDLAEYLLWDAGWCSIRSTNKYFVMAKGEQTVKPEQTLANAMGLKTLNSFFL